jgi:hypothetical protein
MRRALPLLMLVLAAAAQSQTIYRCGPEGRELTQKPCADGKKVDLRAPAPSEADAAAARDVAERDARLAQQLQRERQAREAQATTKAASLGAAQPASAASSAAKGKKKGKTVKKTQAH